MAVEGPDQQLEATAGALAGKPTDDGNQMIDRAGACAVTVAVVTVAGVTVADAIVTVTIASVDVTIATASRR